MTQRTNIKVILLAIVAAGILSAQESTATLYIYREKSIVDWIQNPTVILDGQELARLEKGQIFGVKLEPGEHRLELFGQSASPEVVVFRVQAGTPYYAHYRGRSGIHARLLLIPAAEAQKAIRKLKPIEVGAIKNAELVFVPRLPLEVFP